MEKYLNKCLDSLIVENMNLLEVLIINDGSKDNSSNIAHVYENKYPNTFRVIDKENGNYGSCINRGIKEAKGKYIKVLDADDSFNSKNLHLFLENIKNIDVDLILSDYVIVNESDEETRLGTYALPTNKIMKFEESISKIANNMQMHSVTYLRENILKIEYQQTEGISYTDQEWIFIPAITAYKVIYYKIPLYRYLVGRTGQTMDISVMNKSFSNFMKVLQSLHDNYIHYEQDDIRKKYLYNRIYSYLSYIYAITFISGQNTNSLFIEIDEFIKMNNSSIYKDLEKLKISRLIPFKYVKYWHKTKKSIPAIINFIYNFFYK